MADLLGVESGDEGGMSDVFYEPLEILYLLLITELFSITCITCTGIDIIALSAAQGNALKIVSLVNLLF